MGLLHNTQHMAADVWQCARVREGKRKMRRSKWETERKGTEGRKGYSSKSKGRDDNGKERGRNWQTGVQMREWGARREEFRGSQTLCTPSTADATFSLAQWSVGLLYLYPHCVTSGPALSTHTHRVKLGRHTHRPNGNKRQRIQYTVYYIVASIRYVPFSTLNCGFHLENIIYICTQSINYTTYIKLFLKML